MADDIETLRDIISEWAYPIETGPAIAALERVEKERDSLRAKLEKAREALHNIATLPTEDVNGGKSNATSRLNGGWAVNHARAVLSELSDPKGGEV